MIDDVTTMATGGRAAVECYCPTLKSVTSPGFNFKPAWITRSMLDEQIICDPQIFRLLLPF